MSIEKKKETPQARYDRDNIVRLSMKLNKKTDADVLKKLDSVSSKQGYVKSLIRNDIEQELTPGKDGFIKLTIPKTLHRELAEVADKEGISLEQYVLYMLAKDK